MNWSVFLYFYIISELSAYTLNKIEGIDGSVDKVNFDSNGNIYAVAKTYQTGHQLYIISSTDELLRTVDLPNHVESVQNILINSQNYAYFFLKSNSNQTLARLKSDSNSIEEIEEFMDDFFFIDTNDNLFYSKKNGLHVLKPNGDYSILIRNLESFHVSRTDTANVDSAGNVYFAVDSLINLNNTVALITKEALQQEFPSAQIITVSQNYSQFINNLIIDQGDDLWILLSDFGSRDGIVKKLTKGVVETLLVDYDHPNNKMIAGTDKIFVVSSNIVEQVLPSIFYITLDGEVVDIPELKNLSFDTFVFVKGVVDKEGYVYFTTFNQFSSSLGSMIVVKPDAIESITFEGDVMITAVKLDINDDVWIMTESQGIYYLKKGNTVTERVNIPDGSCVAYSDLNLNRVTNKIFVSCSDGLYEVVNDN